MESQKLTKEEFKEEGIRIYYESINSLHPEFTMEQAREIYAKMQIENEKIRQGKGKDYTFEEMQEILSKIPLPTIGKKKE